MPGDRLLATVIRETLISPNVSDSNGEAANVVDALDKIASALREVAKAIRAASSNPPTTEPRP